MRRVVVTGIGLMSASGDLETSWKALLLGRSSVRFLQPFPNINRRPLALIGSRPANFLDLSRRVVSAALNDANLSPPLPDCAVVLGSSRAQEAEWEKMELGGDLDGWLNSLPHMGAIAAARQIGATGTVLAPNAACASGLWAIARGFEWVRSGQGDRAIVGAVETPISPVTWAAFANMGVLATSGCYPFDRRREGLAIGEGAAVFVLESETTARARGAKIYGQILGTGLTADAHHICAIDPTGKGATMAVKLCCDRAGISPDEIDCIHAHGTGTQLNDRSEAMLISNLFPKTVAVMSTKGATGHTLGASGALGMAFSLLALQQQILPPCVGLTDPEFDLNFVIEARSARVDRALVLSFGFGGQNAAIAVGKFRHV